jgi:hypothetical protein
VRPSVRGDVGQPGGQVDARLDLMTRRVLTVSLAATIVLLVTTEVFADHPSAPLDLHLYVDVSFPAREQDAQSRRLHQATMRALWEVLRERALAVPRSASPDHVRIVLFADRVANDAYWSGTLRDVDADPAWSKLVDMLTDPLHDSASARGLDRTKTSLASVLRSLPTPLDGRDGRPVVLIVSSGIENASSLRSGCAPHALTPAEQKDVTDLSRQVITRTAFLMTPCAVVDGLPAYASTFAAMAAAGSSEAFLVVPSYSPARKVRAAVTYALSHLEADVIVASPRGVIQTYGRAPALWYVHLWAKRPAELSVCLDDVSLDARAEMSIAARDVLLYVPGISSSRESRRCQTVAVGSGDQTLPIGVRFSDDRIRDLLGHTVGGEIRLRFRPGDARPTSTDVYPSSVSVTFEYRAPLSGLLSHDRLTEVTLWVFGLSALWLTIAPLHARFGFLSCGWILQCQLWEIGTSGVASGRPQALDGWREVPGPALNGFVVSPHEIARADARVWDDTRLTESDTLRVWPVSSLAAMVQASPNSSIVQLESGSPSTEFAARALNVRHRAAITSARPGPGTSELPRGTDVDSVRPLWLSVRSTSSRGRSLTPIGIALSWEKRPGRLGALCRLLARGSSVARHTAWIACLGALTYLIAALAVARYYDVLGDWSLGRWIQAVLGPALLIIAVAHFPSIRDILTALRESVERLAHY